MVRDVVNHLFSKDGCGEVGVGSFGRDGFRRGVEDEVGTAGTESNDDLRGGRSQLQIRKEAGGKDAHYDREEGSGRRDRTDEDAQSQYLCLLSACARTKGTHRLSALFEETERIESVRNRTADDGDVVDDLGRLCGVAKSELA
jgi:hypothetical protein